MVLEDGLDVAASLEEVAFELLEGEGRSTVTLAPLCTASEMRTVESWRNHRVSVSNEASGSALTIFYVPHHTTRLGAVPYGEAQKGTAACQSCTAILRIRVLRQWE